MRWTFRSRFIPLSVMAVVAMLAGIYIGASATHASAAIAAHFGYVSVGDDVFRNYDFHSQSESYNNVDWAVTMLYWNNAEVDKVKQTFINTGGYYGVGSTKYSRLTDNSFDWLWDADGGVKVDACDNYHQRLYADGDDRMYNPSWGYFVIATSHRDINDRWFCTGPKSYGWSEDAEEEFAQVARDAGLAVTEDWVAMYNNEPARWDSLETNHFWNNNDHATRVYYP